MARHRGAEFDPPLPSDALLILLALASRPMHGYAIIRDVEERTDNEVRLQTGALYRYLHRLLRGVLIAEWRPPVDEPTVGPARRNYQLTSRATRCSRRKSNAWRAR